MLSIVTYLRGERLMIQDADPGRMIGAYLTELREKRGLTPDEAAFSVGISVEQLRAYEECGDIPMDELMKMLVVYKTELDTFVSEIDKLTLRK